jgi:hypothetical protein
MRLTDPRRETVAWDIARGATYAAAGQNIGVDRSTVKRWMKEPAQLQRIDEIKAMITAEPGDEAEEARRGLARLVPMAEAVVEAGLTGGEINGKPVTSQMHANALKTIELARKLEPRESGGESGAPSLGDLISAADARRAGTV